MGSGVLGVVSEIVFFNKGNLTGIFENVFNILALDTPIVNRYSGFSEGNLALWEFTGSCHVRAGLVPALLWATTRVRPYTPRNPEDPGIFEQVPLLESDFNV
ncbi:MAG: hypothetical protein H6667_07735 [Ardenticatenaceae bacterium]|nr:hypothetical protein [Ardenticatenaceae bacterium]MCB9443855.1 hypothetical protein [Ardenticatenaceae bacterium]